MARDNAVDRPARSRYLSRVTGKSLDDGDGAEALASGGLAAADPEPRPAGANGQRAQASGDEPVPRLPRGRGIKLSAPEVLRIAGLTILLVFLLVSQRPCANAVSSFVTSFGGQGSAAKAVARPGAVGGSPGTTGAAGSAAGGSAVDRYEHLRPGMTDDEVKAVIERARARAGSADPAPR